MQFWVILASFTTTLASLNFSFFRTRRSLIILATSFLLLTILQFQTTNLAPLLPYTEAEQIIHQQRLDEYPPRLARIGHIIEFRPESIVIAKLFTNFINIFNLNLFFHQHLWPVLAPIFLFQLFRILKYRHPLRFFYLLPLTFFTLFGQSNLYGPFLFYPLIFASTLIL